MIVIGVDVHSTPSLLSLLMRWAGSSIAWRRATARSLFLGQRGLVGGGCGRWMTAGT
jgi:hypothetical protein